MMKAKLMAAVAVLAAMTATGAARADDVADVKALKAQASALKKQNEALEKRISNMETLRAARTVQPAPAASDFMATVTKAPMDVLSAEGPITWNGITLFGTFDAGLGWVSHGLPENGKNYEGESLINKFTNHPYFGIAQNNLQQSTLGIKGEHEFLPGWSGVFMASTGFNPQSGQLADMPGTLVSNQGLNRGAYSFSGDGGRGGQAFNDQLYGGLASPDFGQLTFGRHRPFSTDLMVAYDPAGGAYAFSPIAFNGQLLQGLGATEDARWDDSLKYRVTYGAVHAGAMYKFADGAAGCNYMGTATNSSFATLHPQPAQTCYTPHNDAGQINFGGSLAGFDLDAVVGYYHQATIMAGVNAPLTAGQLTQSTFISNTGASTFSTSSNLNTLNALVTDTAGVAVGAKYTWEQFKFFLGYDYENLNNPHDNLGVGANADQGGYILSQANNHFYAHARILEMVWTGVKYAYDPKTDITLSYYHVGQNNYGDAGQTWTCSHAPTQNLQAAQCAGTLDAVSLFADHHFTKRFDVYAGFEVSNVNGGMAGGTQPLGKAVGTAVTAANVGYNYYTNWAPTVGVRYSF